MLRVRRLAFSLFVVGLALEPLASTRAAEISGHVVIRPAFGQARQPFTGIVVHLEPEIGFIATGLGPLSDAKSDPDRQFDVLLSDGRMVAAYLFPAWDEELGVGWLEFRPEGAGLPSFRDISMAAFIMEAPDSQPDLARDGSKLVVVDTAGRATDVTAVTCHTCSPSHFQVRGNNLAIGDRVMTSAGRVLGLLVQVDEQRGRALFASAIHQTMNSVWRIPLNKLLIHRTYRRTPQWLSVDDVDQIIRDNNFHNPTGEVRGPEAVLLAPEIPRGPIGNDFLERFRRFDDQFYNHLRRRALRRELIGPDVPFRGANWHKFRVIEDNGLKQITDEASGLAWLVWTAAIDRKCPEFFNGFAAFLGALACIGRLNNDATAGFTDWRIPTLVELLSLMELEARPVKGRDRRFHIDPAFEPDSGCYWAADHVKPAPSIEWVWTVCFHEAGGNLGLAVPGPRAFHILHHEARLLAVRTSRKRPHDPLTTR